jgi:hypothetical protein
MTPDYYDPRKAGELFLEDPPRIAKAAPNRGFEIPFASTGTLNSRIKSEDDREETRARRHSMGDDLAAANVNRSYSLAATSIAIFTFMLFFLYPRFASGEINALLFQATLVVMGVATFSFVFASFITTAPRLAAGSMMPSGLCTPSEAIASGCSVTPCCSSIRA